MTIPGSLSSPLLASAAAGAAGDFSIARSLRFNSVDSSSLSRTPSSASNRKTWTWSAWVKRCKTGQRDELFTVWGSDTDSQVVSIQFDSNDTLTITQISYTARVTSQVFRDLSSFYHLVVSFNTIESTANDRIKVYINGSQITDFSTTGNPGQNSDTGINGTYPHHIGRFLRNGTSTGYANIYLAECILVDGSALDPTSFGAFDDNGVWQATDTAGLSFGTNGFRLQFADNSGSTATTLGKDTSGNSNNWSPNNLSTSAPGLATANQGMDVVTFSGNGGTQAISGLNFQPDLVYLATRNATGYIKYVFDSVRGTTKALATSHTQGTNAETTVSNGLTAFNSNGFTVGGNAQLNENGKSIVAWCWKAGGAASSNSDGSIASSCSANTTYGFSVCSYVGNGSSGTVGHSLNSAPKMIIAKNRSVSSNWFVYHASLGSDALQLNTSAAAYTPSPAGINATSSTTFTLGGSRGETNTNGNNYVAYVWSEIAGFSKFGSLTSATGGVTVTCGFKPRFILFKSTGSGSWAIHDGARNNFGSYTLTDTNTAEGNNTDFTVADTGFTFDNNSNGTTFIYAVFAAKPDASGIDSLVDTPSNGDTADDTGSGSQVTGNYCTLNPLVFSQPALSNGNLEAAANSSWKSAFGTIQMPSSGKWYWEATPASNVSIIGMAKIAPASNTYIGDWDDSYGWYGNVGKKVEGPSNTQTSYANFAANDVIGLAYDADAGTLSFYKNGVSQGNAFTGLSGSFFPVISTYGGTVVANFGARAFAYSAPTNHKSLNTANLPTPTIADGSKYFDTKLFTGNGGTNAQTGLGFSPDFVWLKRRNLAASHNLFDIVRGATKFLGSDGTNAEQTGSDRLTAFDSNGFTLGSNAEVNNNNDTYVGWAWDGGNGDKTYAITVANPGSGNKYYADGALQPTLTLAEGSTYKFDQSNSSNSGHPLRFSTTSDGTHNSGSQYTTGVTTAGTPGNAGAFTQIVIAASAPTLYAYCTNHSGMGFQVNTSDAGGFTIPADSLTSSLYNQSQNWTNLISFNAGGWNGNGTNPFDADATNKDYGNTTRANGGYATLNISSLTGSRVISVTSEQTEVTITHAGGTTTFTPSTTNRITHTFDAVTNPTSIKFDGLNSNSQFVLVGVSVDGARLVNLGISLANVPAIASQVRAQPSAGFSICTYSGSGSNGSFGHGLNAVPELVIVKCRSHSQNWAVQHSAYGPTKYTYLNSTNEARTTGAAAFWNNTAPTNSTVSVGTDNDTNASGRTYVAYCFAPVNSYSAMGSYQGNGNTSGPFVHTGFRPAVIILKRTDSASSWQIRDTTRSPHNVVTENLYPNLSNAESTDSSLNLDILSNGFKPRTSTDGGSNASGGTYIYYAVAENPFQANGGLAR